MRDESVPSSIPPAPVVVHPSTPPSALNNPDGEQTKLVTLNKKFSQLGSHPVDVLPMPLVDVVLCHSKQVEELCSEFIATEQDILGDVLGHYLPAIAESRKQVDMQPFQAACVEFAKTAVVGKHHQLICPIPCKVVWQHTKLLKFPGK